jgi:hypothetical protein
VGFDEYKDHLKAVIYVVDSKEFSKERGSAIRAAAKVAYTRITKEYGKEKFGSNLALYWSELKRILRRQGITWSSPEELNPEVMWYE